MLPSSVVTIQGAVGLPITALGHSMECFLVKFNPGLDLLYLRVISSLIMNVLYIILISLLMFIGHRLKKFQFKAQYVSTMLLYMFIYLHPSYVQDFILMVSKRTISDHPWVQANVSYRQPQIKKKNKTQILLLGWPGLFMWGIFLPFSFLYVVFDGAKKKKLQNIFFKNSWGFFYNEYREGCYYWEFVKIFQKQLMIIVLIFYTDDVIVKVFQQTLNKIGNLNLLNSFWYGRATQFNSPYTFNPLNKIDILSSNCCGLTIIIGLLIYRALRNDMTYIVYISYIALGLVNAFFIFCIMYFLVQTSFVEFRVQNDISQIGKIRQGTLQNSRKKTFVNVQSQIKTLFDQLNQVKHNYQKKMERSSVDCLFCYIVIKLTKTLESIFQASKYYHKLFREDEIKSRKINKDSTIIMSEQLYTRQRMVDLEIGEGIVEVVVVEQKGEVTFSPGGYQDYDEYQEKSIQQDE